MNHWSAASASSSATPEDEPLIAKRGPENTAMGRARELLRKLETSHEPGLTSTQLMLTNDDLKPGRNLLFFLKKKFKVFFYTYPYGYFIFWGGFPLVFGTSHCFHFLVAGLWTRSVVVMCRARVTSCGCYYRPVSVTQLVWSKAGVGWLKIILYCFFLSAGFL